MTVGSTSVADSTATPANPNQMLRKRSLRKIARKPITSVNPEQKKTSQDPGTSQTPDRPADRAC